MKKILYIIFFLTLVSIAYAQSSIVLPNAKILGAPAASTNEIIIEKSGTNSVFPNEVRFVVKDGMIDEIQLFYDPKVAIDQIAAEINSDYKDYEIKSLHSPNFRMWRISSEKFVIQLSQFSGEKLGGEVLVHEGDKLLIYTRISKPKKSS